MQTKSCGAKEVDVIITEKGPRVLGLDGMRALTV